MDGPLCHGASQQVREGGRGGVGVWRGVVMLGGLAVGKSLASVFVDRSTSQGGVLWCVARGVFISDSVRGVSKASLERCADALPTARMS